MINMINNGARIVSVFMTNNSLTLVLLIGSNGHNIKIEIIKTYLLRRLI